MQRFVFTIAGQVSLRPTGRAPGRLRCVPAPAGEFVAVAPPC
jgi:hypothetical protein